MVWWARVAVAGTMGGFGCGGDDGESQSSAVATGGALTSSTMPAPSTSSIATTMPPLNAKPQALAIESRSGRIEVGAFYFGTSTMVADGTTPPSGPPLVEGATVQLVYPAPGWTFTAVAQNDEGGKRVRLEVRAIDEHRYAVAAPPPGSYEILVDGKSSGGEVLGAGFVFRWMVTR
jgi:hypothetical protein